MTEYTLRVKVLADSLALLAAEKHTFLLGDIEFDQYVEEIETLIAERLVEFENDVTEEVEERFLDAIKYEARKIRERED